jgi:phosphoribosylanthranilate isomerase
MRRTRIKICGLTRAEDVAAAAAAGADALGFNCYPRSPRFVDEARLRELASALPPFVTPVLLFVNATPEQVGRGLALLPHALLQFHGDETPAECERYGRPYLRALRMVEGVDLLDCERSFPSAMALLADAPAPGYGGSGIAFDWSRLPAPERRSKPLVLAGGLNDTNVMEAIVRVRPFAVDVSSGVEDAPGLKSAARLQRFCAAVRAADAGSPL